MEARNDTIRSPMIGNSVEKRKIKKMTEINEMILESMKKVEIKEMMKEIKKIMKKIGGRISKKKK